MAGNAIIGALRIILGADTAALDKGLKDAQSRLASFGAGVAKAGAAAGVAFAAAGVAIGVAVKGAINEADNLGKMAQKIGVPVAELSALKHAADLSGVGIEELGKGLGKLSKTMVEAAAKPTSEAANAFRALGVSVTDGSGRLKSSSEVMADVAGKFEGLKDGAGKTAIAMALFGKAGANLIPLLNTGKTGLQEMRDEAAKLGIVIDNETAKSAEAFNDNLTRLGKVVDGISIQIAAGMLKSLEQLSASMVRVAKDTEGWKVVGEKIGGVMVWLVNSAERLGVAWQRLGVEWQAFTAAMATVPFTDASKKAWAEFTAAGNETKATLDKLTETHQLEALADAFGGSGKAAAAAAPKLKEFNYAAMGGKNALDQFIDSQIKSLAGQQAEIAATGMATGAKERLKVVLQGLAVAQANGIVMTEAQRLKLTETANAAELMALKLGNIALLGETNPFAAIGAQLDATNLKLQQGGLNAQDYATLSAQAGALSAKVWETSAQSLGNSFESIGTSMAGLSNNWARMAKIGQAIGAAVAFVNSYVAASEAFAKTPFPANVALAAGVLAKGLAMVVAIKGAAIPNAAMGGAFRVPGGVGGGDSVRAMIDLEPGELVEVSSNRPGGYQSEGRGGASRSGGVTLVHIDAALRPLAEALFPHFNAAIRDGHELKLATA